MLTVGIDLPSSARSIEIAHRFGVYASVGVHPNSATQWDEASEGALREMLRNERVVAVGESGLDFYRDHSPHDVQRDVFSTHIVLAKEFDKTLVIHTRDSIDTTLEMLEQGGAPDRLIFHCWSGDEPSLQRALALGAYVSFAGNVSYGKNDALRAAAQQVPADRLLVETDSPYLSPKPYRHLKNEPAFVVHVGEAVAAARAVDVEELAALTSTNARTLLGV